MMDAIAAIGWDVGTQSSERSLLCSQTKPSVAIKIKDRINTALFGNTM